MFFKINSRKNKIGRFLEVKWWFTRVHAGAFHMEAVQHPQIHLSRTSPPWGAIWRNHRPDGQFCTLVTVLTPQFQNTLIDTLQARSWLKKAPWMREKKPKPPVILTRGPGACSSPTNGNKGNWYASMCALKTKTYHTCQPCRHFTLRYELLKYKYKLPSLKTYIIWSFRPSYLFGKSFPSAWITFITLLLV